MARCPDCNCAHTPVRNVLQTTKVVNGKTVHYTRRYRVCRHCGNTFTTVEVHEDPLHTGIPAKEFRPGPEVLLPATRRVPPKKRVQ